MPVVPAAAEGGGQLEDEPPEPRARGGSGRASLMKPLVVLALPGMYLFYKYSQYRQEQRELSRRWVTERELQHLHHKIDKLLTKLEKHEPELASSQEDERKSQSQLWKQMIMKHLLLASVIAVVGLSIAGCAEAMTTASSPRDKRSPDDGNSMCGPPNGPPCGPPPNLPSFDSIANGAKDMVVASASSMAGGRSKRAPQQGGQGGGGMGGMPGMGGGMDPGSIAGDMGNMAKRVGNMFG